MLPSSPESNIAIRVRGLSKKYTLRDAIVNLVKVTFHRILHRNSDPTANEFLSAEGCVV